MIASASCGVANVLPPMNSLPPEDQIVASIRRIMRAVDMHSRQLIERHGFTGPQLATLHEAARLGPSTPSALARAVHLSNATVTGIVTRLERRGYLVRRPGERDRRTVRVEITDLGREALSRSPSLLQDRFRARLRALEEWEQNLILATLQRVATMMDAEELDAAPHLMTGEPAVPPVGGDDEPPAGGEGGLETP